MKDSKGNTIVVGDWLRSSQVKPGTRSVCVASISDSAVTLIRRDGTHFKIFENQLAESFWVKSEAQP